MELCDSINGTFKDQTNHWGKTYLEYFPVLFHRNLLGLYLFVTWNINVYKGRNNVDIVKGCNIFEFIEGFYKLLHNVRELSFLGSLLKLMIIVPLK